jgi:hypothetical protein
VTGLGGDGSVDVGPLVLAACAILALTVLSVFALAGGRAAPDRWRSALDSTRAARRELGEALPFLLAVGLAASALAVWIVLR